MLSCVGLAHKIEIKYIAVFVYITIKCANVHGPEYFCKVLKAVARLHKLQYMLLTKFINRTVSW